MFTRCGLITKPSSVNQILNNGLIAVSVTNQETQTD